MNKPAGLAVHRSKMVGNAEEFLIDLLREQVGGSVYLAHRLDRATSGVLLIARASEVAAALGEQFMGRDVHKQYLAVVRGWPDPPEDLIDYPLPGSRETGPRREARTRYRRLATVEVPIALGRYPQQRYALVLAEPETGRFRQIRKHWRTSITRSSATASTAAATTTACTSSTSAATACCCMRGGCASRTR